MKRLFKYWWSDKLACSLNLVYSVASVAEIWLRAKMILLISGALSFPENVQYYIPRIIMIYIVRAILQSIASFLYSLAEHHLTVKLYEIYTDKLMSADYKMFTDISCSKIITASHYIPDIAQCGKMIVALVMAIIDVMVNTYNMYLIGGDVVFPVMFIYFISSFVFKKLFSIYDKLDKKRAELIRDRNQELDECINGFAEVRSRCSQKKHTDSLSNKNKSIFNVRLRRSYVDGSVGFSVKIMDCSVTVVVLMYILKLIGSGAITSALGYSMIMYTWRLIDPILDGIDLVAQISESLSFIDQIEVILNYKNTVPTGVVNLNKFDNSIKLKDVTFSYGDSSEVISNINMDIPKGFRVGICGSTGGGKSTLLKLLSKFYSVTNGEILIDGVNINDIETNSLRSKIGFVHQDNHIFNGSVYDNVVYGNWEASEAQVIQACVNANIYDFIKELPDGFQTLVGPKGLKLSGGQKQRIALARLFLSDPDIILLDEATSALDNECETIIQEALKAFNGKTIITVAHRLSTIRDSDIIYVIDNHTIIESGNHQELMDKGGVYASLNK